MDRTMYGISCEIGIDHGEHFLEKIGPPVNVTERIDADSLRETGLFSRLTGFQKAQHN
jgi:hypothetical protein